jgi:adenylosuccinate synthase
LLDGINGKTLGTTGNGIGYAYAGKALRVEGGLLKSLRLGDYLANPTKGKKAALENIDLFSLDSTVVVDYHLVKYFDAAVSKLESYLCSDPLFLEKKVRAGLDVFFEGAQAAMLDVDHGTYPFVTSSNTVAGAAYVGGDLSPRYHHKTIGVAKAIMSRVGNGPFASEFGGERSEKYCMEDGGKAHTKEQESAAYNPKELLKSEDMFELGVGLRMLSNEYGATTGRPRRLGMFDLVQLKQVCALNGVDELYINKFDQLALFEQTRLPGVPVVTGYVLDGKEIDYIPTTSEVYRRVTPKVYYLPYLPEISRLRQYHDLPQPVRNLISFIEDFVEVKIHGIGVGPERDEFVDTSPEERVK